MSDDELDGACCGTCAHARLVAQGKIQHPPSPVLRIREDTTGVFVIARRGSETRRVPLARNVKLTVGRAQHCDLSLPGDPALSRMTCVIEVTARGEVFVEDLKSSCGTLVNGARVLRSALHEKDEIRVGNSVLSFELT